MDGCGREECSVSTGICGSLTAGTGKIDFNGYFEFPCQPCVDKFTELMEEIEPPMSAQESADLEQFMSIPTMNQIEGWKKQLECTHRCSGSESRKTDLARQLAPYLLNCVQQLLEDRDGTSTQG